MIPFPRMPGTIIDMHLHTTNGASDSALRPDDLAAEADSRGLGGVNITEHDRLWDAFTLSEYRRAHPGLFVNNGMEVSTDLGHMLVVGLPQYVAGIHRAEELRRVADQVGAFVIVAHPFRHYFDPVYFTRQGKAPFEMTAEQAARLPVFQLADAVEVLNGANTLRENLFALRVAAALGKPGTGGSDAHSTQGIGVYCTQFEWEVAGPQDLLAELHAGRFQAAHGLLDRRLLPFSEESLPGPASHNA